MSIGISNAMVGLSLLSGTNSLSAFGGSATPESFLVRRARSAFTLPETTPPWKQPGVGTGTDSTRIAEIKRLVSLIDKPASGPDILPQDVQTSFTAYKALDRLRLLAESAAKATTGDGERAVLDTIFSKGLDELRTFLGQAPSDKLELSFGLPTRRAETVGLPVQNALEVRGQGVVPARDAPIPGVAGNEVLTVTLRKPGVTDTVQVDLAQTSQPPTLDSIANALNAAIAAIPQRNPDNSVVVAPDGTPQPRWMVQFVPNKMTDKWGFALKNPAQEDVSIDQVNGKDALLVATGQTALDAPATIKLLRFDDPANGNSQLSLGDIAAYDRLATDRATLIAPTQKTPKGVILSQPHIDAVTSAAAIVTANDGSSYVVGTAAGELDANRPAGAHDLFLTKLDSEGRVQWQRMLGAAKDASGAAVSIAANGDVLVAGTIMGPFDGQASDGDMLVARYDTSGNEKFASLVRSFGADQASAITSSADGSIFLGGKAATGGGDALIVRLDAAGKIMQRRTISGAGSERVSALAIAPDNSLLALTKENGQSVLRRIDSSAIDSDLATLSLGATDARSLAVDINGAIAVGGATDTALSGAQVNIVSGGRDGFVTRVDAGLNTTSTTYIGTSNSDEVDSVAFLNGRIYAGGRTSGTLGAVQRGPVDGFVTAIDAASGTPVSISQFGQTAQRTEPVRISAAAGGATVLGALGLARGTLTQLDSPSLVAQTTLRAGDSFSVAAGTANAKKITIAAAETLGTLADKLRRALGSKGSVTTPTVDGKRTLRIEAKLGSDVELIAGSAGSDALDKLGLAPTRLAVPEIAGKKDPTVRPGGTYGLALSDALSLTDAKNAAVAVKHIKAAISTAQTAYRSLYWDDGKAALVDGAKASGSGPSAYQSKQLARYQDALTRISAFTGV